MSHHAIYELKLKPVSGWITDLTADTIFGHLCWQIKYEFGDEVLREFLNEMGQEPIFTLSDILPLEGLPRPITSLDSYVDEKIIDNSEKHKAEKERIKHYCKIDFISQDVLGQISNFDSIHHDNIKDIRDFVLGNNVEKGKYSKGFKRNNYFSNHMENKNIINRYSATTGNNGIYSQSFVGSGRELRLLLKQIKDCNLEEYHIGGNKINFFELILRIFAKTGFGKNKSTGKGIFELSPWYKNDFFSNLEKKQNKILLLSPFIPSSVDSTKGNYRIFTKFPKMGEEYSLEGFNFYKKPLVMINTGACFDISELYTGYVGKMIENVDFNKQGIYHYAYGFTLEF